MSIKIQYNPIELYKLKKEWLNSLPRYTSKELLEIFPEVKNIISAKLQEFKKQKNRLLKIVKNKLILIEQVEDELSAWFWREWLKINEGKKLLKINNQIAKLKRLQALASGNYKKPTGWIEQDEIERVLQIPLIEIAKPHLEQLKQIGNKWFARCPFHNEKTPSFYIFEDNRYKCFGACGEYGNAINFIQKFYDFSFPEAVKFLLEK